MLFFLGIQVHATEGLVADGMSRIKMKVVTCVRCFPSCEQKTPDLIFLVTWASRKGLVLSRSHSTMNCMAR